MISKDRLIFDPADLTESDNMGAYLRAGSDGDLITSTLISGKESLDVHIVGDGDSGIYAEDVAHVSGDKGVFMLAVQTAAQGALANDGDYTALQVDSSGRLRCLTDIDLVGDLTADDDADNEDPLKVGTRAVSSLSTVSANDKANMVSDLHRRLRVNIAAQVGTLAQSVTVGTTAVALPAAALAGRVRILVQNVSNNDIYVGDSGVTTASGVRIGKGASLSFDLGQGSALYAIAGAAGNDIRVLEAA
jgi:hypothetical protein